jgi:hypothetical protein
VSTKVWGSRTSGNALVLVDQAPEGREQHPVSRRQPRPADPSAQNRHLVSQDKQLDVLVRLTPTTKDNQRKRSTNQQVHQRKNHKAVFQPDNLKFLSPTGTAPNHNASSQPSALPRLIHQPSMWPTEGLAERQQDLPRGKAVSFLGVTGLTPSHPEEHRGFHK